MLEPHANFFSWILKHPKRSVFYPLWAGEGMLSIPNLYKVQHVCVCVLMFVRGFAEGRRKKLHCDISLCNLVSQAVLLSASHDQNNNSKLLGSVKKDIKKWQNVSLCVFASLSDNIVTFAVFLIQNTTTTPPPHPPPFGFCHRNVFGLSFFVWRGKG